MGGVKKSTTLKRNNKPGAPEPKKGPAAPRDRKKAYANNAPIYLGYWNIRGLAQGIRYMLEYIEHPYEEIQYEQGDAPNYSVEAWTSVKHTFGLDFPTLPYLIDGNFKLTNNLAIMIYLAQSYAPELIGQNPLEMATIDMMYAQLKDITSALYAPCYQGADREELKNMAKSKMQPIVAYLGKKDYLLGAEVSILDFCLLELCDFVQFLTDDEFLTENPTMKTYYARMRGSRKIHLYINSDRYNEMPFNNKNAMINNI